MYKYPQLHEGTLIERYKRFFVDIQTAGGVITAHNANTGSMKSLLAAGNPVLYSVSSNPKRSLPYSLELIGVGGEWIVSNTTLVNKIVEDALLSGDLPQLYRAGEHTLRREFPYKDSRIDFLIEGSEKPCLVEVKSVTYFDDKVCYFPDAVTTRGLKHLHTLLDSVNEGYRAVMLYVCFADRPEFKCACDIDPEYCAALDDVTSKGVEKHVAHGFYDIKLNSIKLSAR